MDTSDRGLIDIERYDQDRDYPFFHGMAGDLSWSTFKEMPIEDRKALVFRILDFENLSERGRNSIQEIGTKLLTWPQLASDVTAGGGHATTVARNILLGKNVDSGRYYIDVEEIIGRGEKNS